jgi:hypothetical protein
VPLAICAMQPMLPVAARSGGLHDIHNLAVAQPQGELAGALKSYQDSLSIRDRLAKFDPGNAGAISR